MLSVFSRICCLGAITKNCRRRETTRKPCSPALWKVVFKCALLQLSYFFIPLLLNKVCKTKDLTRWSFCDPIIFHTAVPSLPWLDTRGCMELHWTVVFLWKKKNQKCSVYHFKDYQCHWYYTQQVIAIDLVYTYAINRLLHTVQSILFWHIK